MRKSLLRPASVLRRASECVIIGFIMCLPAFTVQAQDPGFDDLNRDPSNEFTLEVEDGEAAQAAEDLIRVDPVRLVINRNMLAAYKPDVIDPSLVHAKTFRDDARIQQGSQLLFKFAYHAPEGLGLKRRASLFSKLADPEHRLHEDTEFELGGSEDLELNWRRHAGSKYVSVATINNHIQQAPRSEYAGTAVPGQSSYTRYVFLETANLKPGDYKFVLKVYRKDGGETPETDFRSFRFTVVKAPLSVAAFMPDIIAPYNYGKSLHDGEYEAGVSDWAVPPYRLEMTSSVPGFSFGASGKDMSYETGEALFYFYARPKPGAAGKTANLALSVTDGLGRQAVTHRKIRIGDGKDSEIRVSLPETIKAGQTVRGSVSYPPGFKLKKPPKIGDMRGFEWTSSDFTAFRLTPAEEGIHHKRLFALIASGTMAGMDSDPVLVWKREYAVKSQDLIYDEARNRRKAEANKRAWREAMGAIAAGVGEAAEAYASATPGNSGAYEAPDKNHDDGDGGYVAIMTPASSGSPMYEIVGRESGTGQVSGSSGSSGSTSPSRAATGSSRQSSKRCDVSPQGVSGQLDFSDCEPKNICGIDNSAREWRVLWDGLSFSRRFVPEVGVPDTIGNPNARILHISLEKRKAESGTTRHKKIEFYARNCVMKWEFIPRLDEYSSITYWDNGGKKKVEISDGYTKKWDRAGNLTQYWPKDQNSTEACSNTVEKYKRCSR